MRLHQTAHEECGERNPPGFGDAIILCDGPETLVMHSCEDTFFKRTAELSAVQPVSFVEGVATVTFLTSSAVVFRARTAAEEVAS